MIVGSVKTNIGHLESASGVAGLLKLALSLQHGSIPAHLHFRMPSPHIAWDELPVVVPSSQMDWPEGRPRIGGVSSFGASGTNAHVILEHSPEVAVSASGSDRSHHVLTLSAESESALHELSRRYLAQLDARHAEAADVCYTAAVGRSHFTHRAAIVGRDASDFRAGIDSVLRGVASPSVRRGLVARGVQPKIAFLFTGQGAQYAGMGRELFESQPAFREALEACDRALQPHLEPSLLSLLYGGNGADQLNRTQFTQPALFSFEYALARMLAAWGVQPVAVLGHSVGEFAAACVAGVMGLDDAAALIAARGRLMGALPEGGAMVAIAVDQADARRAIERAAGPVALAAINAPDQVVLSGERASLERVLEALHVPESERRWLSVSHAFHSPLLAPMLDRFTDAAAAIPQAAAAIPFVSNVTGQVMATAPNASYWRQHAMMPVDFAAGVRSLAALECTVFVEIGPTPTLLPLAQRTLGVSPGTFVPTLRRGRGDWEQMSAALGALYTSGVRVDWRAADTGRTRRRVTLPFYPFARDRHWFESSGPRPIAASAPVSRPAASAVPESYEIAWRRLGAARGPAARPAPYIVIAPLGGGAPVVQALEGRAVPCIEARIGSRFERVSAHLFEVRPASREDFEAVVRAATAEFRLAPVVIFVGASGRPVSREASLAAARRYWETTCGALTSLVQALGARPGDSACRLFVVTAGAAGPDASDIAWEQSALVGLARTVRHEYPELRCTIVDLDPEADIHVQSTQLLAETETGSGEGPDESHVALRAGDRYAARLTRRPSGAGRRVSLTADATYLVTGGLGGAGFCVAEWLASRGAKALALAGRSGPSGRVAEKVRDLERQYGVRVHLIRADVGDRQALAAGLDELARAMPPIRGVVHAAGVLDDGVLLEQDWARFERVFAPKAFGAWNLHELLQNHPVDFFLMFSSLAGLAGSSGQANYAAANALLDGLAAYRRRRGLPAVSVAWGPWQVGMLGALDDAHRERWARLGLAPMAPERATGVLDQLLIEGPATVAVADADWSAFLEAGGRVDHALLSELTAVAPRTTPRTVDGDLFAAVVAAPLTRRVPMLIDAIDKHARAILGGESSRPIDPHRPLGELGLDSLMALELRNTLCARLDRRLPATLLFDYPSIAAVADFVLRTSLPADASPAAPPDSHEIPDSDLDGLSAAEAEVLLLAELSAPEESWTE